MARPSKSVNVISKNLTKEEKKVRKETEEKIKGKSDKLEPPKYLNRKQKKIFRYILKELEESDILGNLDIFVLSQASIAIERLETLEEESNNNDELKFSKEFKSVKEMYSKDFFRCCNELCLSPQSRAKIAIGAVNTNKSKKTIMDILGEDDD